MNVEYLIGLMLVVLGGVLQGTFILPMTLTRKWAWEHNWLAFSVLGMLALNWLLAGLLIPDVAAVYRATPAADLWALLLFGGLWGAGAILFGLGMQRLGMALGYPVIMGLILSLGALIPLLLEEPGQLASGAGVLLLLGTAVTLAGIVLCSQAAASKDSASPSPVTAAKRDLGVGLTIAVFAGVLSCFPNVGMNYAAQLKTVAVEHGASEALAGNAAWALLFTAGFVVNSAYCIGLMWKRGNFGLLAAESPRNIFLVGLMALMWIGSFYLYGTGAARLGRWGGIIGWPLFISLSIVVGNIWGLVRGEWAAAPAAARRRLADGIRIVLAAVVVFAVSSAMKT
jgi:L-rhamnose-H+ transport protein